MKFQKKIFRVGVIALGLTLFIAVFGVGTSRAQVLKEVLDRMDGNYKTLNSFQASMTMVKYNDQLGTRDNTESTVKYLPKKGGTPMYVRIDWTKPTVENLVVIGDKYLLYRPKLGVAYTGVTTKASNNGTAGGALSFVGMSKAELQANYYPKYIGQEGVAGNETWHILLIPKKATSYKSADLWVDKDGMPRQAMITEKNDDTTTVRLSGISKNVKMDASVFKFKPPAGTTFQST